MRKLISCTFALVLISMFSSCALSEEIDILGEWSIYPFLEEQGTTAVEVDSGNVEYGRDGKAWYEVSDNGINVVFDECEGIYRFSFFESNNVYSILTFGQDEEIAILSTSIEKDGYERAWKFYEIEKKSEALFMPTRMISDEESMEYLYKNGVLYVADESEYERGNIEIISENAFIWHIDSEVEVGNGLTYHYAALMLR